ncbi:MAG: ClbS/DfsB family four-helix bundle protein, partial [Chloroflexi bacterium]|nr:ClbS/DfsB family four-helix bundle protein [Chloroflexota bacterium]
HSEERRQTGEESRSSKVPPLAQPCGTAVPGCASGKAGQAQDDAPVETRPSRAQTGSKNRHYTGDASTCNNNPMTKDQLLAAIRRDRTEFEACLALGDDALTAPGPDGGWSVKDHLSHIAAWERMIVAHLRDGTDHEIAGMDAATYARASLDDLNTRLHELHAADTIEQVRRESADAHAAIVAFIEAMPEARLDDPYWDDEPSGRTVVQKIAGDTYLHYREHGEWIYTLLADFYMAREAPPGLVEDLGFDPLECGPPYFRIQPFARIRRCPNCDGRGLDAEWQDSDGFATSPNAPLLTSQRPAFCTSCGEELSLSWWTAAWKRDSTE